jgi:hypothetical protein
MTRQSKPITGILFAPKETDMGLQKYRADRAGDKQKNGGTPFYTCWMGGPTLALIRDCKIDGLPLDLESSFQKPHTVYVVGEPNNAFSIPAACRYTVFKGQEKVLTGHITTDESGEYYFQAHTNQKSSARR